VTTLTVLSRSYCHLCDDLIAHLATALERHRAERGVAISVNVIDVDRHADLEAKWGDKVPVLLDGDDEICHYFLDAAKLRLHLAQL
jgi:hypothetical protein